MTPDTDVTGPNPAEWTWQLGPNPGPVFEALAKVMADLPGIEKSERNTQQNFDFRGIDSITAQTRKLFGKHGLAIIPRVRSSDFEAVTSAKGSHGYRCVVHVDYTIGHSSGGTVEASMQGEAIDYGDKSASKAVQMAFKYLLTELLHIGSGGDDPDAHSPEVKRSEPDLPDHVIELMTFTAGLVEGDMDVARGYVTEMMRTLDIKNPLSPEDCARIETALAEKLEAEA